MALVLTCAWRELQRYKGEHGGISSFEARKRDAASAHRGSDHGSGGRSANMQLGAGDTATLLRAPSPSNARPSALSPVRADRSGSGGGSVGGGSGGSGGGIGLGLARGALGGSPARKSSTTRHSAVAPPTLSLPPNASTHSRSTSMFLSSSPDLLSRRSARGTARDLQEGDLDLVI